MLVLHKRNYACTCTHVLHKCIFLSFVSLNNDIALHHEIGYMCFILYYKSGIMRKPTFFICEKKGADQLRSHSEADHRDFFGNFGKGP